MALKNLLLYFLCLALLARVCVCQELVTLRDKNDREIQARLLSLTADYIEIERTDGKRFNFPLELLSENSRQLVEKTFGLSAESDNENMEAGSGSFSLDIDLKRWPNCKASYPVLLSYYSLGIEWEKSITVPGKYTLQLPRLTDKDSSSRLGTLRIAGKPFAGQFYRVSLTDEGFIKPSKGNLKVLLHPREYAVIDYAYYEGEDRDFNGREPAYSGRVALAQWGKLSGMGYDWMLMQSEEHGANSDAFGDTLFFRHHRVGGRNGFIRAVEESYDEMVLAPETGYRTSSQGKRYLRVREGDCYYIRVGSRSARGYGKLRVVALTTNPTSDVIRIEP
ncbi:MAG: hypothetical protein ACSHYA_07385 [Opitutaceae bacterium]